MSITQAWNNYKHIAVEYAEEADMNTFCLESEITLSELLRSLLK